MFGSTAEYENSFIGELFDFYGKQLFILKACITVYDHKFSINTLGQQQVACHKFVRSFYFNISKYILKILNLSFFVMSFE